MPRYLFSYLDGESERVSCASIRYDEISRSYNAVDNDGLPILTVPAANIRSIRSVEILFDETPVDAKIAQMGL